MGGGGRRLASAHRGTDWAEQPPCSSPALRQLLLSFASLTRSSSPPHRHGGAIFGRPALLLPTWVSPALSLYDVVAEAVGAALCLANFTCPPTTHSANLPCSLSPSPALRQSSLHFANLSFSLPSPCYSPSPHVEPALPANLPCSPCIANFSCISSAFPRLPVSASQALRRLPRPEIFASFSCPSPDSSPFASLPGPCPPPASPLLRQLPSSPFSPARPAALRLLHLRFASLPCPFKLPDRAEQPPCTSPASHALHQLALPFALFLCASSRHALTFLGVHPGQHGNPSFLGVHLTPSRAACEQDCCVVLFARLPYPPPRSPARSHDDSHPDQPTQAETRKQCRDSCISSCLGTQQPRAA